MRTMFLVEVEQTRSLEVVLGDFFVAGGLVGDGPHDDCRAVFVATHQLLQHLAVMLQRDFAEVILTVK